MMRSTIMSIQNAPHFLWGEENCHGWWLKKDGQFTVIAETIPPGASETKHYHDKTEQVFYVLKGRLTIEINEINHMLEENECITVMPCTPHKVFNQSNAAAHFLVISCPNSHEDCINVDD